MKSCAEFQEDVARDLHGQLSSDDQARLRAHTATCSACAAFERGERALTELLGRDLPVHAASMSLKQRLAARWLTGEIAAPPPPARRRRGWVLGASAGLAFAAATALLWFSGHPALPPDGGTPLVAEAINDHLRLLDGERPLQVLSSDFHQVKPWFAGRLEFAPAITFTGDPDFVLEGGAISRFLRGRAASLVYRHRLHKITLLIVPADDAGWKHVTGTQVTDARGFSVVLWRHRDLGYALISDLGSTDLLDLQQRINSTR